MAINQKIFLVAFCVLVLSSCHRIHTGEYSVHQKTDESLRNLGTIMVVESEDAYLLELSGSTLRIEGGNFSKREARLTFRQKKEIVWIRDLLKPSGDVIESMKTDGYHLARKLFDREKKKGYSSDDLQILLNTIRNYPEIKEPLWITDFTYVDDHPIYGDGLTAHQRRINKGDNWWWQFKNLDVVIDSYSVDGYAYLNDNGFEFLSEEYDIIFTKTE